ncbi:hypothetical protein FRB94_001797 [Tulasnella sp. JGI-2019a]|nr:hypothetical protein FRB94_001797 [Tulasnella sp. JGI-2019a]
MDDLWGNAWSDPTPKTVRGAQSPINSPGTALGWSSPLAEDEMLHATVDPHTAPPWTAPSIDSGFGWASSHPLDANLRPSAWAGSNRSPAWGNAEPHEATEEPDYDITDVALNGKDEKDEEPDATAEAGGLEAPAESIPKDVIVDEGVVPSPPVSLSGPPSVLPEHNELDTSLAPTSLDGFQTLETVATAVAVPSWSPPPSAFHPPVAEEAVWGGGWVAPVSAEGRGRSPPPKEDPRDAWARAQAEQAERDRRVPPQFLDSILAGWTELSWDLFPSKKGAKLNTEDTEDDEDIWPEGLERVEGLSEVVQRLAPRDAPLLAPQPFPSTSVHKQMRAALKLTRNLPATRMSPLSHLSGRSSLAWEAAIKESIRAPAVSDWASLGVQPKELESTAAVLQVAPTTERKGGLMSFFSRTASVPGPPPDTPKSSANSRSASPSRRSSEITGTSTPPISSPVRPGFRNSIDQKPTTTITPSSDPQTLPSGIKSPLYSFESGSPTSQAASPVVSAPSAVSRFLGRFSKGNSGNASGAHTVSLSDSDFTFLEDVPTIGDEGGEDHMKSLEKMLATKPPLPPTKLPPHLAPPPQSSSGRNTPQLQSTAVISDTKGGDDLWSAFQVGPPPVPKPAPRLPRNSLPSSLRLDASTPPLLPPPSKVVPSTSRPTTPILPPPRPTTKPLHTVANPSLLARRVSSAASSSPASPIYGNEDTGTSSLGPSTPSTPKPTLSPIITSPGPNVADAFKFNGASDDDGFGDFMSVVPDSQLLSAWPQPTGGSSSSNPLRSPRITAPDTPNPFDKALPPARRSLSPLMNKVAKTQSDRWPRPLSPGVLPPALAPPPQNARLNGAQNQNRGQSLDLWDVSSSKSNDTAPPTVLLSPPPISGPFQASAFDGPQIGSSHLLDRQLSFPPPPSSTRQSLSSTASPLLPNSRMVPLASSGPPLKPTLLASSSQSTDGKGKLSASDLSFFEGL